MSSQNQFALLKTRRFLPLFIVQAIGAFNDNLFRTALTMLYTYVLTREVVGNPDLIASIMAGLLILPFLLFSALAGQIADKFDKAKVAQNVKFIEIGLIAVAAYSLFTQNIPLQLFCVFTQGLQSAFFGPVKYGVLPQYLPKSELLAGNGLIEMGTFLSILLGVMAGSILAQMENGTALVSSVMVGLAIIAWIAARFMPAAPSHSPELELNWNVAEESIRVVNFARTKSDVWLAILGISWFFFLGSVFVAQIIPFTKADLMADANSANVMLLTFSIATALGSVFCNWLLGGKISLYYVPWSGLIMSLCIFAMWYASRQIGAAGNPAALYAPAQLFASLWGAILLLSLFFLAFSSGLFVVPLFALMLARTPYYARARIVGANNIVNALFMVGSSLISAWLISLQWTSAQLYLALGLSNLAVAVYLLIYHGSKSPR